MRKFSSVVLQTICQMTTDAAIYTSPGHHFSPNLGWRNEPASVPATSNPFFK